MKHEIPNLSRTKIDAMIDEYIIGKNAERDRAIIKRRLFDGICYEPLAEEYGLSVRQTKTIVYKSIQRLLEHI